MNTPLDRVWKNNPEIIRGYYEKISIHQRLCDEVKYILEKKIKKIGVEIGHLSSRAKTLESFCEKIERKSYGNPFSDVADLSGVRIVFLYVSDRIKLENLVEEEFEVHERVDKIDDQGSEKFGYGALHYIVSLKEQHAGVRYDDLRNFKCEIQIRTILQDGWAIVAHHLSYKHEADIPDELKRKLNALSGLFETADDQFEGINRARLDYQSRVKLEITKNKELSLDADINLDNLMAYMSWKFPERRVSEMESASELLQELHDFGYKKLKDLDDAINRARLAFQEYEKSYPPTDAEEEPTDFIGIGVIRISLQLVNADYLLHKNSSVGVKVFQKFLHLVEKD